jgi:hypothetical protein
MGCLPSADAGFYYLARTAAPRPDRRRADLSTQRWAAACGIISAVRTPGLAPRGRGTRFIAWACRTYSLERPHAELVTEAGRLLDRLDAIAERVAADGLTVAGSRGQHRPHPLLSEQRQAQLALGRLLDLLGLTEPVAEPETRASALARHAAEVRWRGPTGVPS